MNSIIDINVTIKLDRVKSDLKRLKQIIDEISDFKISAKSKDEALRQWTDNHSFYNPSTSLSIKCKLSTFGCGSLVVGQTLWFCLSANHHSN